MNAPASTQSMESNACRGACCLATLSEHSGRTTLPSANGENSDGHPRPPSANGENSDGHLRPPSANGENSHGRLRPPSANGENSHGRLRPPSANGENSHGHLRPPSLHGDNDWRTDLAPPSTRGANGWLADLTSPQVERSEVQPPHSTSNGPPVRVCQNKSKENNTLGNTHPLAKHLANGPPVANRQKTTTAKRPHRVSSGATDKSD